MMDFQADSIQIVLFLEPGSRQDDSLQLWSKAFPGDNPDSFQRGPAAPSLQSSAAGDRKGYQLGITTQVGRIDLMVNAALPGLATNQAPPRIGDIPKAIGTAIDVIMRLLDGVKTLRVAFVLDCSRTVLPGEEGDQLRKELKGVPYPADATDIVYQFNSRKPFDFDQNLFMNRLCTFSSGHVGYVTPGARAAPVVMTPFVGVKIDLNSAPHSQINSSAAPQALREMANEAIAILDEGLKRFAIDG